MPGETPHRRAGGYELTYRRLAALPEVEARLRAAIRAVEGGVRLAGHSFRLVTSEDAPPQIRTDWTVTADGFIGPVTAAFQTEYGLQLGDWILAWFLDGNALTRVARESYGREVKKVYPCDPEVVSDGRRHGKKGGYQPSFASWLREAFTTKFSERMEVEAQRILREARERTAAPEFQAEQAAALQDLAVEDLAQKMVHYSRIPDVIDRACKLFVVKDVMEG